MFLWCSDSLVTWQSKVKYTWICIARLCINASNALRYGSHSVTCKQHHICLYSQSQNITALWRVLIAPTHRGMARLSWPGWLVRLRSISHTRSWTSIRSPIPVLTRPAVDLTNVATNWAKLPPNDRLKVDFCGRILNNKSWIDFCVQKLGQLLADFVQTFRPAAKMVSIAGLSLRLISYLCVMYLEMWTWEILGIN